MNASTFFGPVNLEAFEPFFSIRLARQRKEHHVPLAAQLLDHSLAAQPSSLKVVGADKVQPVAGRSI
jgi:hypothetical protein